jgi:hypothetical protein
LYELGERGSVFIPQRLWVIEGFKEGVEKELMREYAAGISHHSSVVEHGKERALLDIVYLQCVK